MRLRLNLLCGLAALSAFASLTSCGGSSSPIVNPNPSQPEVEYYYEAGPLDVSAYKVDLSSGRLTQVQNIKMSGNQSTMVNGFVATSPAKFLYMSTPLSDGIMGYSIGSDGSLTVVPGSPFQPAGYSSPAYSIAPSGITPSGKHLYAIDGFNSELLHFEVDSTTGALTYSSMAYPGFNPGGMVIDPSGSQLYVPADIANLLDVNSAGGVLAYDIDASGNLSPVPGSPFPLPVNSEPSGIVMDPTGSFVYVSLFNQGEIVVFKRDASTGALKEISGSPFATSTKQFPELNSIAMTPSGKFLYAFDLNGDTLFSITGFTVDSSTGALTKMAGSPFKPQSSSDGSSLMTQGPITIDAFGRYAYVLCNYPAIAAYSIDSKTGALSRASGSPWSESQTIVSQIVVQAP